LNEPGTKYIVTGPTGSQQHDTFVLYAKEATDYRPDGSFIYLELENAVTIGQETRLDITELPIWDENQRLVCFGKLDPLHKVFTIAASQRVFPNYPNKLYLPVSRRR
jgi:hypothetical protein